MKNLFDYSFAHYKKICSLIRTTMLSDNINEINDLNNNLTATKEFNYITEDDEARDTLYYICAFNSYFEKEEREFIVNNRDKFENLFT